MEFDTIAAISTALGEGAIAIVRVSGDDAIEKVDRIFKGKDLTQVSFSYNSLWSYCRFRYK